MYKSILAQMYVFLVLFTIFAFYHEIILAKIAKKIFFCQNYVYLVEHTLINSSQRTVVHIHKCFSLKFTQHVTVAQTESNQEVTKN